MENNKAKEKRSDPRKTVATVHGDRAGINPFFFIYWFGCPSSDDFTILDDRENMVTWRQKNKRWAGDKVFHFCLTTRDIRIVFFFFSIFKIFNLYYQLKTLILI